MMQHVFKSAFHQNSRMEGVFNVPIVVYAFPGGGKSYFASHYRDVWLDTDDLIGGVCRDNWSIWFDVGCTRLNDAIFNVVYGFAKRMHSSVRPIVLTNLVTAIEGADYCIVHPDDRPSLKERVSNEKLCEWRAGTLSLIKRFGKTLYSDYVEDVLINQGVIARGKEGETWMIRGSDVKPKYESPKILAASNGEKRMCHSQLGAIC